jgi:hypothetical protein
MRSTHPIPLSNNIVEVKESIYEDKFKAFLVDAFIYFFEDEGRGRYSVVFGGIAGYSHRPVSWVHEDSSS